MGDPDNHLCQNWFKNFNFFRKT